MKKKPEPAGPAIADARATAEELCRQLALERGFAVLARKREGAAPEVAEDVRRAFAGFDFKLHTETDLEPLLDAADFVLVRSDTPSFDVALVRLVLDGAPLAARLPMQKLADLGSWLGKTPGAGGGLRSVVRFLVFEVHSRPMDGAWIEAAKAYRRRAGGSPSCSVGVVALEAQAGRPWGNEPGLDRLAHAHLLRRAYLERGMGEAERRKILARKGWRPLEALGGLAVGALLGIAGTEALLGQLVAKGDLYAGVAIFACLVGAVVSTKSPRICTRPLWQSLVGGLGALAAIAGYWIQRGLPFGRGSIGLSIVVAVGCFVVARTVGRGPR